MRLDKALSQLTEIHAQLAKTSHYRGYRSLPVALSGLAGFVAAGLQPLIVEAANPRAFVLYWVSVAVAIALPAGGGIIYRYLQETKRAERRKTETVVGQSLPSFVAGFVITLGVVASNNGTAMALLPAIWAFLYGLSVFASRPYLPRMIGWAGLYYFVAGAVLVRIGASGILSRWGMGLTFGIGQLTWAVIHYWNLERKPV